MKSREDLSRMLASLIASSANTPARQLETERRALATEVFSWQSQRIPAYGAFCRNRGTSREAVTDIWDLPALPVAAFKYHQLCARPDVGPEAVFLTSGTTGQERGRHIKATLLDYERSYHASFERYAIRGTGQRPMLSLTPTAQAVPESSLGTMLQGVMKRWASPGSAVSAVASGLDSDQAWNWIEDHKNAEPVLIMGTAFAWLQLLDEHPEKRLKLPSGSGLMETGGLKGRTRDVSRQELYALLSDRLGVPLWAIFSEYGMTELSSQLYDPSFRHGSVQRKERDLEAPVWCGVRVVDPDTLEAVPEGATGLVQLCDLANIDSISSLLTSDLGRMQEGRLQLVGRASGAELRGCSLAVEELWASASQESDA